LELVGHEFNIGNLMPKSPREFLSLNKYDKKDPYYIDNTQIYKRQHESMVKNIKLSG
jgi:hypothetical protein